MDDVKTKLYIGCKKVLPETEEYFTKQKRVNMGLIIYVKTASLNGKCVGLGASGENVDNVEL